VTDILGLVDRQRELLTSVEVWQGIRNRSHLYEYADLELALIDRFNKARSANTSSRRVEVEGFVSIVGGRRFILRPSLAVDYGLLCDASAVRSLPRDYEFVRVSGYRTLLHKASRYAGKDRLAVTDLERIRLPVEHLKPQLSMKDAEERIHRPASTTQEEPPLLCHKLPRRHEPHRRSHDHAHAARGVILQISIFAAPGHEEEHTPRSHGG
jgi:hypothetical protein